jgi:GNAT superfamily N-acetyltransferase
MNRLADVHPYDPVRHYAGVADLWRRALGDVYPMTERVLALRLRDRPTLCPEDGFVAGDGDRILAFGMAELSPGAGTGAIQALIVDPGCQRRGIGSDLLGRLEERARRAGREDCWVSTGLYRFWSGIPEDLPRAAGFFERHGYARAHGVVDMYAPLGTFEVDETCRERFRGLGITVTNALARGVRVAGDFIAGEQPSWSESFSTVVAAGDAEHVLLLTHGDEIVGVVQTFAPRSIFRGANLVHETVYGRDMGGFGAVLIAKAWRGRGLGSGMIQFAAEYLQRVGATGCFIDWTSDELVPFYGKIGARVVKRSGMYSKPLRTRIS